MNKAQAFWLFVAVLSSVLIAQWKESPSLPALALNVLVALGYAWSLSRAATGQRWGGIFLTALFTAVMNGTFFNPAGFTLFPALAQAGLITFILGLIGEWGWRRQAACA